METLNEHDYLKLFDLLKMSLSAVRYRYKSHKIDRRYALHRALRVLSYGTHYNSKLYKIVKDAKRAIDNPTMTNLYGAKVVNEMIDIIDNIYNAGPTSMEEDILELRESLSNMTRLNNQAKEVSSKCETVAGRLDEICQFIEGSRDEL